MTELAGPSLISPKEIGIRRRSRPAWVALLTGGDPATSYIVSKTGCMSVVTQGWIRVRQCRRAHSNSDGSVRSRGPGPDGPGNRRDGPADAGGSAGADPAADS